MIQANELRIGNFVLIDKLFPGYKQVIHKVESICEGGIKAKYAGWGGEDPMEIEPTIYDEQMSGIPLTPDILEGCGFGLADGFYNNGKGNTLLFDLTNFRMQMAFVFDVKPIISSNILFLHQLQNLYFALTGEELTIKL